jgi:hypothetical protein
MMTHHDHASSRIITTHDAQMAKKAGAAGG